MSAEFRQPAHLIHPTDELSAAERRELIESMRPEDAEGVPQLHEVDVPPELRERIETTMARYPQLRSAAIPALWAVQEHYGWCSPAGIRQAAAVMGVTPASLEALATFYDLFATVPVGRHRVFVCHNISCWLNGGDELLRAFCAAAGADPHEAEHHGASSEDGEFFVKGFECLGACDLAPMASMDNRYYGPLDAADAVAAIEALRAGDQPLPERALVERPAAGGPEPPPDPRVARGERENRQPAADPTAPGREAEDAAGRDSRQGDGR
jgi:NADH-quinone oxidoreductase subunit E